MGAPGAAAAAPHAEPPLPADLAPAGDLPLLPPLASDLTPPVLVTDEQHAQYANDGYTFFPSLIDREAIAELRHAVDQMVEHAVGDFSFEPSDPSLIQRITGPHRHSRVFAELTRNEALCGAIAQIIGPSFRHNNIKLNFKPPRVGSAVEWHQDWAFYPHTNGSVLAAGIFLDDVDEENGCELSRSLPSRPLARSLPTLRARLRDSQTNDGDPRLSPWSCVRPSYGRPLCRRNGRGRRHSCGLRFCLRRQAVRSGWLRVGPSRARGARL